MAVGVGSEARKMFYDADAFSQPLGKWNTTAVTDMSLRCTWSGL